MELYQFAEQIEKFHQLFNATKKHLFHFAATLEKQKRIFISRSHAIQGKFSFFFCWRTKVPHYHKYTVRQNTPVFLSHVLILVSFTYFCQFLNKRFIYIWTFARIFTMIYSFKGCSTYLQKKRKEKWNNSREWPVPGVICHIAIFLNNICLGVYWIQEEEEEETCG